MRSVTCVLTRLFCQSAVYNKIAYNSYKQNGTSNMEEGEFDGRTA